MRWRFTGIWGRNGPLTRYVKLRVAPGMPGTVTTVPWCMSASLTSGFRWSGWRGKTSPASQFCVSGKRPIWAHQTGGSPRNALFSHYFAIHFHSHWICPWWYEINAKELMPSRRPHYNDVIMNTMASHITSLTIIYSTGYSGADERKHQSSASLAFVRGIHRWPRWIACTNDQWHGFFFHLMTSSCSIVILIHIL